MSHLLRAENVRVGTRLRYLGREFTVTSLESYAGAGDRTGRVARDVAGRSFVVHDGFTVWEMEDRQ